MQVWKRVFAVALCLGLLSGVWSCRTPAGRTAGQVLDDAGITTVVKSKLFRDPYLSGFTVGVDTFEGQVTLTGAVDSDYAKQRATDIVNTVDGVRKVNNNLIVR